MTFSDTSTRQGLIQECERITGLGAGNITGDLLKDFTARLNNAMDRFYALAFQYDSLWNMDDRRYADGDVNLPIATTNLVSGQADYLFDDELLMVTQVFIKNSAGAWVELSPQDDKNSPNIFLDATSGLPATYELVGNSIYLNPTPNYNSTGGLKVTFKRNGVKFNSTDGGVAVGIPTLFHAYLAREASLTYLVDKRIGSKNDVANLVARDEEAIKKFVSQRAKPKRVHLGVKQESNR
jgi:hypothetical protein